jgi:hypothetical protein
MDPIESKLSKLKWSYAEGDPDALATLVARVEDAARREDLINYSNLVRGVWFHLPNVNKGQPFQIDVHDWRTWTERFWVNFSVTFQRSVIARASLWRALW